jgi:hypothetical protein
VRRRKEPTMADDMYPYSEVSRGNTDVAIGLA